MRPSSFRTWCVAVVASVCTVPAYVHAQMDPVFTYQGQLKEAGLPYNGFTYLEFTLWDAPEFGTQIGDPFWTSFGVDVVNGLFTVEVDAMLFGPSAFHGAPRWLQVVVTDWNYFERVELSPRHAINPAPYALFALDGAGGGGGTTLWSKDANDNITYNDGFVGMGLIGAPTDALEVGGTIKMNGLRLGSSATAGHVLTVDANGVGTWQPGGGGGSALWSGDTFGINYQSGNVGIGAASTSGNALNVRGTGSRTLSSVNTAPTGFTSAVWGETWSTIGRAVYGSATADSGTATGVQGETASPNGFGVAGFNDDDSGTGEAVGVFGTSGSLTGVGVKGSVYAPGGSGVYGFNEAESGDAVGVYGETATASGFGGYFVGRGFFSNSVGIGTAATTSQLTVAGTIQSNTGGFKFPDGTVQTTAATGGGGESLWETNGYDIYYSSGNVGVGTADPRAPLHVAGGNWDVATGEGDFKIGSAAYRLKIGVATSGGGAGHSRIFAAGPSSKLTLGASGVERLTVTGTGVGIGTVSPSASLDVNGTLRLRTAPTDGYVLTSDASGFATWQPGGSGGSFDLPFTGSVADTGSALRITNTGTGTANAITGIIDNATSSDAAAGYFFADGVGMALYATSNTGSPTIRVQHSNASGDGISVYSSGDTGGDFRCTGTSCAGVEAEGTGVGVRATSTGDGGVALRAVATGAESNGIYATSPYVAVAGTSAYEAARFKGRVRVYKYGTTDTVFLVDSDGITKVDVLQIVGGADLSEQFDVAGEEQPEPGSVVCIDPDSAGKLVVCDGAYDRTVAGIISGAGGIKTGMMMGQHETLADGAHPVALTGRVYVWADATSGPIRPGDLLTTSHVPGHAMKVTAYDRAHGATLGKAMTPLTDGRGLVLVLVSLQ